MYIASVLAVFIAPRPELPNFKAMFGKSEGCFLAREIVSGREVAFNPARIAKRFPPCSTFKIPHTAMALDAGVAKRLTEFKWDGKPKRMKGWERDFTLEPALKNSAVWVYEQIASQLGRARSADYLRWLRYGNQDLSGWPGAYWLMSSLRISVREQVDLLTRLVRNDWPLRREALETTKEWLMVETGTGYRLFAKTGSGIEGEVKGKPSQLPNPKSNVHTQLGWYVGWLESGRQTWVFAANYRAPGAMGHRLAPNVRKGFVEMGLLPKATE